MKWTAAPRVDEDLMAGRDFIRADNERAALAFLDTAFEVFELLAQFPEMGLRARFRHPKLKTLRFFVLPPPFNRWLVFYRPAKSGVEIARVVYGTVNWRQESQRFF
jgi:plasmid stabilization system protein ParE